MTQIKKDISMTNGAALGTISLALDLQDLDRVARSGPLQVNFGGEFATTAAGSATEPLKDNPQTITTITFKVSQKFSTRATPADNEQVATDWMADVEAKIVTALGTIRANDAALVDAFPTYTDI